MFNTFCLLKIKNQLFKLIYQLEIKMEEIKIEQISVDF